MNVEGGWKKAALWVGVILVATACSLAKPSARPEPVATVSLSPSSQDWPNTDWQRSTAEQQGMDSARLTALLDEIRKQDYPVHGLVIVRNGALVLEAYAPPYHAGSRHYVASVTKSVISALVGIAVAEGKVRGVDQKVLEFFPERHAANSEARKQAISIAHVLSMSSGLDWPTRGLSEDMLSPLRQSQDWLQFILDRPMSAEPGMLFNYNSGGSHILSAIIQKSMGMSAMELAKEKLFGPLGISDVIWAADPNGINPGGWGLDMTPRDMAKFGYLYLKNGIWDNKQATPADWVKSSTTPHIDTGYLGYQYGYHWWINQEGYLNLNKSSPKAPSEDTRLAGKQTAFSYHARGYGGQRIFVLPQQAMVVVFTGGFQGADMETVPEALLDGFILPAVQSDAPLPDNPEQEAALQKSIEMMGDGIP